MKTYKINEESGLVASTEEDLFAPAQAKRLLSGWT
jgi:hypothetical protein